MCSLRDHVSVTWWYCLPQVCCIFVEGWWWIHPIPDWPFMAKNYQSLGTMLLLERHKTSWSLFKDIKISYPLEVSNCAISKNISEEPVFPCWVTHTLYIIDSIINTFKTRYWKWAHKFGLAIPNLTDDTMYIYIWTGTEFGRKSLRNRWII